ncbi:unnamed protein product [Clonostachys rosea f. rosea IK726]|uniref:Uncharacterized protein n=1 Tax=Clonostachys rosea f. rosea IK726 TaxID=1349383 RepID=A0ACA9UDC3_BIOOC|nr:unnamed protein product [Clonostachys rosea f. rosea IK726]
MSGITSESHIWTPEKGLQSGGYISEGVISPPRQVKAAHDHVYDVVVIGAGYSIGLTSHEVEYPAPMTTTS